MKCFKTSVDDIKACIVDMLKIIKVCNEYIRKNDIIIIDINILNSLIVFVFQFLI